MGRFLISHTAFCSLSNWVEEHHCFLCRLFQCFLCCLLQSFLCCLLHYFLSQVNTLAADWSDIWTVVFNDCCFWCGQVEVIRLDQVFTSTYQVWSLRQFKHVSLLTHLWKLTGKSTITDSSDVTWGEEQNKSLFGGFCYMISGDVIRWTVKVWSEQVWSGLISAEVIRCESEGFILFVLTGHMTPPTQLDSTGELFSSSSVFFFILKSNAAQRVNNLYYWSVVLLFCLID